MGEPGGLGEWLRGIVSDDERRADERRSHAGTFGGRMPSTLGEFRRDAGDALTSFLHATGIDTAGAHVAQLATDGSYTGPEFQRYMRQGDEEARAAEQRSPIATGGGEAIGDVAPYAVGAGTGGSSEAAPALAEGAGLASRALATTGRVLRAGIVPAGETAAYSGATSRAPTTAGAADDAIAGGVFGGLTGILSRILGEGVSAATSPEVRRSARRAADRQRVASVRGESRGTISHRDFDSLIETLGRGGRTRDERLARAAAAVRETGVVGPASSVGEIADRVGRYETRATERMNAIQAEADAAGGSVPADAVPRALEEYAASLDPLGLGRWADAPREEARIWRASVTPGQHGAEMRPHPAFGPDTSAQDQARSTLARIMGEDIPPIPAIEEMRQRPGDFLHLRESQPIPGASDMSPEELAARRAQLVDQLNEDAYGPRAPEAPQEAPAAPMSVSTETVSPASRRARRSVDPRRSAAAREGHARRVESDEFVEHDLNESLVPVWRSIGPRERARFQPTPHASRAEVFQAWAHDHGADVRRMQIDAQERGLDDLWSQQPSDATPTPREPHGPTLDDADAARTELLSGREPRLESPLMSDADLASRMDYTDRMMSASDALRAAESAPESTARASGLTVPRQRAEDALRILDRTTQWVTPSGQTLAPDVEVRRGMRRVERDTIDDALEPFLSPERMAEYPQARREYSHARAIGDVVRPAEERAAGRSSLASAMQAAGPVIASGGGAAPAAAAGLGYRFLRGRGASMDATALEALSRALDASPGMLSRWRPRLERARRTGTLAVAHRMLSADPEYATEAERAISASGSDQERTDAVPDRSARARAARAELARRELARRRAAVAP